MADEAASSNGGCTLTREELLGTTNLNTREWRHIDPEIWDDEIEAPDDEVDATAATTYIARAIADYTDRPTADAELFGEFCQDFEGWTQAMFERAHATYTKELKRILRFKGVYTGRVNMPPSEAVAKLLRKEDCPKWPDDQFRSTAFDKRSFAYMRQERMLLGQYTAGSARPTSVRARSRAQSQTSMRARDQDAEDQETYPQDHSRTRDRAGEQLEREQQLAEPLAETIERQHQADQRHQGRQPSLTYNNFERFREYTPAYPQRPKGPSVPPIMPSGDTDPYKAVPPIEFRNEKLDPKTINVFTKMWDREKKYTGKPYDLLDDKLKIFYSICYHADIQPGQFHAVFPRILEGRAQEYYLHYVDQRMDTFLTVYTKLKNHFDTDVNHSHYYADWTTISFAKVSRENPDKTLHEVLDIMLDKLQLCQRALGQQYMGEYALRTTVITACRGVKEFAMALYRPSLECEVLFGDLRSSIENSLAMTTSANLTEVDRDDQYYVDRRYSSNGRIRGRSQGRGGSRGAYQKSEQHFDNSRRFKPRWKKKCFVCQKEGCWSTNHTDEEREAARAQFFSTLYFTGARPPEDFSVHLAEYEGSEHASQFNQKGWRTEEDCEDSDDDGAGDQQYFEYQFFKEQCLADQAFLHHISGDDIYSQGAPSAPASQFLLKDRYTRSMYQGILPDTGAANVSTVGKEQYLALTREDPTVMIDTSTAGKASIKFGKGEATASIGTVQVSTEIGKINFEVLEAPTPFLLCLADMDRLKVYFNNTTDELVQDKLRVPVLRKWGHPWFHLNERERATVFLTDTELRRLHRRFGHPAVMRLAKLLKDAGHNDFEERALEEVTRFCHHCQLHSSAPRRFKFTLKDDHHFNYEILVDVMYLSSKPVLHVVDSSTAFQGAKFLSAISAKETWQALRMLWIDTYQGPPDIITHDAGTNFASAEFRAEAKIMGVTCKQVPTEAHWSVGKTERYHAPLRRAWEILHEELQGAMSNEAILQMAVKAVNDTAGPDGLVPTLLVFGAYPRMTTESPPSPSMVKRSEAIQKATKALRRLTAERQVADALNARNGPATADTLALPLQSEVLVWRESDGWNGPYKIASIDGHNVTVDMVNGPATFRSTVVKPYYRPDHLWSDPDAPHAPNEPHEPHEPIAVPLAAQPRKRGRPPGSKNKRKARAYITRKEEDDLELAIKLRNDGVITTLGAPFEASDDQEISDLVGRGVFKFEQFDERLHSKIRIFKSRLVREIKGKTTKPYEKSRLVIQGYQDHGKEAILTQSPTIQRCSQRLIMAIAPALVQQGMTIELRDITQAYPQAHTSLKRTILAHLPTELVYRYPKGTLLHVIKPLYGIAEAGVHWWTTYHGHHCKELGMSTSTYDPCLLITNSNTNAFGIVGMQTDDTLMLGTTEFSLLEEKKIQKAQFRSKPKAALTQEVELDFNGCILTMKDSSKPALSLQQKGQGGKIRLVDIKSPDRAQQYLEQRARGAYIASTCQPEASFDLSVAAQAQQPSDEDIKALNKRLKWQMENLDRGLRYVTINLMEAKLMVFVDGSFANNKDLSSQLGFILMLVNESANTNTFTIRGNVIHYSSTKCKRVTRSVLASEIYGMVNGFDIGIAIATTLRMVTERLGLPAIPLVICTDSYSLYECLVKLGTTKEKRLMIDIMALRQSYERREITEIRWINGDDNPADAFTKALPNRALERLIDNNELAIRVDGWVQRPIGSDV